MNTVRLEKHEEALWIYLSRPAQLNALNEDMIFDLEDALDIAEQDETLRCILLTGEGDKAFAAGADIKAMEQMSYEDAKLFSKNGRKLMDRIANFAVPTIAAINGFAFGGGLELALACDFRFAKEGSVLGLPEVTLGIMPGWDGSKRLAQTAGYGRACEMIFTGKTVPAEMAKEYRIVNEVFPKEAFLEKINATVQAICRSAPIGIRYAKCCMREKESVSEELFAKLFLTQDQKTGMRNFNQKCKTKHFEGK